MPPLRQANSSADYPDYTDYKRGKGEGESEKVSGNRSTGFSISHFSFLIWPLIFKRWPLAQVKVR